MKLRFLVLSFWLCHIWYTVVVQWLSHVQLFVTPWTEACQASQSFTIYGSLLKLMSIESVMPSNHLILCHPLLFLPSIFPSIRVFSNELALRNRWSKYWSFSFSISTSNEYSGLISFRIDWFDLLAVQGTLKSLLQHHNMKAAILQCWALFPGGSLAKNLSTVQEPQEICIRSWGREDPLEEGMTTHSSILAWRIP